MGVKEDIEKDVYFITVGFFLFVFFVFFDDTVQLVWTHFLDQGLNSGPLQCKHRLLTTELPGNPQD